MRVTSVAVEGPAGGISWVSMSKGIKSRALGRSLSGGGLVGVACPNVPSGRRRMGSGEKRLPAWSWMVRCRRGRFRRREGFPGGGQPGRRAGSVGGGRGGVVVDVGDGASVVVLIGGVIGGIVEACSSDGRWTRVDGPPVVPSAVVGDVGPVDGVATSIVPMSDGDVGDRGPVGRDPAGVVILVVVVVVPKGRDMLI